MAEITAALVKELREKSGAGMMDCKKALAETGGDIEAAVDWLRTKGLAAAAKKAGRVATEGLVGVVVDGNKGALIEVNAETDFVARNEAFQSFVQTACRIALETRGDLAGLVAAPYPGAKRTVAEEITHLIATIGENMSLRRCTFVEVPKGVVGAYVHNQIAPGLGKIGVLVALESDAAPAKIEGLAKQLAMHVAAAQPQAVDRTGLDPQVLERERAVLAEQARASGKPAEIIDKMVEGRIRKFYEEVCLVDQTFVIDGESKVGQVIEKTGKEAGGAIACKGFVRYALGEGIEKEQADFAAEVAAAAGR